MLYTVVIALCLLTHLILRTSYGVSTLIYPHFTEPKHREVNSLTQGHTASM